MAEHVVIVDDDELLRSRLAGYLASEGFRVTTAEGAAKFRDIMAHDRIDLALVDITMPGEDGLSLTRFLRERSEIGVVILTGKGDPIDRAIGLEIGADDYVANPFTCANCLPVCAACSGAPRPGRVARVGRSPRWCVSPVGASIWPSAR